MISFQIKKVTHCVWFEAYTVQYEDVRPLQDTLIWQSMPVFKFSVRKGKARVECVRRKISVRDGFASSQWRTNEKLPEENSLGYGIELRDEQGRRPFITIAMMTYLGDRDRTDLAPISSGWRRIDI